MKDKINKVLHITKNVIEGLWTAAVIIWNLPVGIIELLWTALFDREKFKYNWRLLRDAIRGKSLFE